MFYEYALDPKLLSDTQRCTLFFESFRNRPARLVADVPKKWQQEALLAISNIPNDVCKTIYKKTLKKELLKVVRENMVSTRGAELNIVKASWLDCVLEESQKFPFAGVLGIEAVEAPLKVYSFDQLLFEKPDNWDSDVQSHIYRNGMDLIQVMSPLLKVSKNIHLVDPYFRFTRPRWENYEELLKALVKGLPSYNFGRGIARINIHTSDRWGSMEHELEKVVDSFLPDNIVIKVRHWSDDDMHDRFILTDVGGMDFGHGLDDYSPGKLEEVKATVLAHSVYKKELAKIVGQPRLSYEFSKGNN